MKINLYSFLLSLGICVLFETSAKCQCTYTPTIDQADTVICSSDNLILMTQTYDSYQWYYSGTSTSIGSPINGETNQSLSVNSYGYYTVEATAGGCSEFSNTVLVDTWVFLLPAIISTNAEFCEGDSSMIELINGNWTNIQWYKNGSPIPGANNIEYWVTEAGTYIVEAAPQICPNEVMSSGVGPSFTVHTPTVPQINWDGTTLTSTSAAAYQWNLNSVVVGGATSQTFAPTLNGYYTVTTTDVNGCEATSDSVLVNMVFNSVSAVDIDEVMTFQNQIIQLNSTIETDFIQIVSMNGSKVWNTSENIKSIDLSFLHHGPYIVVVKTVDGQLIRKKIIN